MDTPWYLSESGLIGLKPDGPYHKDRRVQAIIVEIILQPGPLLKEFHHDHHLDFDPQSTESPPKMEVLLVGRIGSLFAPRTEMKKKKIRLRIPDPKEESKRRVIRSIFGKQLYATLLPVAMSPPTLQ